MSVNGRSGRASQRVRAGDVIEVLVPEAPPSRLEAEDFPLAIVHEDDDVLVVDKPAGLVVHPGAGVRTGTLVHALLHRHPEIAGVGGEGRPGIVHRLDRETSGLLVVARTARAYRALIEAMRARRVRRGYRALVWGDVHPDAGSIEAPIGRDPRNRKRMAVVRRGGRPARTHWEVRERFGIATHLGLTLDTGRTHQIRVHLANAGHPVIGDPLYGGRGKKLLSPRESERSLHAALLDRLRRQALHASELAFAHPVTGQPLRFTSAAPSDVHEALGLLRAFANTPRP